LGLLDVRTVENIRSRSWYAKSATLFQAKASAVYQVELVIVHDERIQVRSFASSGWGVESRSRSRT
jgi:hypothetical protein